MILNKLIKINQVIISKNNRILNQTYVNTTHIHAKSQNLIFKRINSGFPMTDNNTFSWFNSIATKTIDHICKFPEVCHSVRLPVTSVIIRKPPNRFRCKLSIITSLWSRLHFRVQDIFSVVRIAPQAKYWNLIFFFIFRDLSSIPGHNLEIF